MAQSGRQQQEPTEETQGRLYASLERSRNLRPEGRGGGQLRVSRYKQRKRMMDDNKLKALLDEMETKRKQAESNAQMEAMNFVETNDPIYRALSLRYLYEADIWQEAAALIRKQQNDDQD